MDGENIFTANFKAIQVPTYRISEIHHITDVKFVCNEISCLPNKTQIVNVFE